jgi:hypothetical protein
LLAFSVIFRLVFILAPWDTHAGSAADIRLSCPAEEAGED